MTDPTLVALAEAVASRKKSVAAEVWPRASERTAQAKLDRVLSGELGIPARLLRVALTGHGGEKLAEHLRRVQAGDPQATRRHLLAEVVQLRGQLEFVFTELRRTEEAERERLVLARVQGRDAGGRKERA